jgi:two-component system cell cycle sensor histidine kinase/response regulator CckA
VVEDEEALLSMLKEILETKGYHVITAVEGLEALALFQKHKDEIALVLTDIGLPKITGDQLFFKLRELNPAVKVIMASGYLEPNARSEILKAGAKDIVQKPYLPGKLLKKIREILDQQP